MLPFSGKLMETISDAWPEIKEKSLVLYADEKPLVADSLKEMRNFLSMGTNLMSHGCNLFFCISFKF
jgi:hypothetical protein